MPAVGDRDSDDLRQTSPASFPSESYVQFLRNATTTARIGAEVCRSSFETATITDSPGLTVRLGTRSAQTPLERPSPVQEMTHAHCYRSSALS